MDFYKTRIKSIGRIEFACLVRKMGYKNRFPHTAGLLEISLLTKGEITRRFPDGREEKNRAGSVTTITRDLTCVTRSEELQEHISVGLVADYDYELLHSEESDREALAADVAEGGYLLLPYYAELPEMSEAVSEAISAIIRHNTAVSAAGRIKAISAWYNLAALLTESVLRALSADEGRGESAEKYVRRAKAYIKERYKSGISVSEIAENIGISAGYLHGIFKESTGMSIIAYTNLFRVNLAIQYIKSRNYSLKEAAFEVGIDDPAYMSRLFKKITGVSYRKFREGGEVV